MTTIYRTCNSDQLEGLTEHGWVIDQTPYEDHAVVAELAARMQEKKP